MTLDSLFDEAATLGLIFDLKQTSRGWDILLWEGSIGYSRYVHAIHTSPHHALRLAIDLSLRAAWHELDTHIPTCALDPSMQSLLEALVQPAPLSPPRFRLGRPTVSQE